jgi:ABC-type multidrug transport system fused ATPase/permease subunit
LLRLLKNILLILQPREKSKLLWVLLVDVIISIADIFSMALLIITISFYTGTGNKELQYFMHQWFGSNHSLLPVILLVSFFALKNLFAYLTQRLRFHLVYNVAARISERNLLNYLEGHFSNYVNVDSAIHIRRISHQPVEFAHYVLNAVLQMNMEFILIVFTIAAISFFNAKLFLILILLILPPVVVIAIVLRKRLQKVRSEIKSASNLSLQNLKEAVAAYVESNIYNSHDFFVKRYSLYQSALNRQMAALQIIQKVPSRLMEVFAVFGIVLLILINYYTQGNQFIDIVTLSAFVAAAYKIIPGIVRIMNANAQIRAYEFTVDDLLKEKNYVTSIQRTGPSIQSLQFNDVSFSYRDKPLLNHFNCTMSAGEMIGISGPSGIGKSTWVNLLLGFLEPTQGHILLNNRTATAVERQQMWGRIAYVKQQNFIIHDSIRTNITLHDHYYNPQKLDEVLELSGLKQLLGEHVLDTIVAENGKNISGGQRQRIALARAFYKEADVYILDEPFSELDHSSEQLLLAYLQHLASIGKMIILITHNQSALNTCTKRIQLGN